jgi:hypothetical protein
MKFNFNKWFKNLDIFGIEIGFTHDGQRTFKTAIGAALTLMYAGFVLYYSIQQFTPVGLQLIQ